MKECSKAVTIIFNIREVKNMQNRHIAFNALKAIFRLFKKRPDIVDLSEKKERAAIFVANHNGASGPITYSLYLPAKFLPWGAHEMCGSYPVRWHYLYHVFYRQKLGYSKTRAFLIATPFAVISRMIYKGAELIPTYRDIRLRHTLRRSVDILRKGKSILIFPENSDRGYKDYLEEYHGGFVSLAKLYFQKTGHDIPIYTVYYSNKANKMVISGPRYIQQMLQNHHANNRQLAELFRKQANDIYEHYILHAH